MSDAGQSTRCLGRTVAGVNCKRNVKVGQGNFCWQHKANGAPEEETPVVRSKSSVVVRTSASSRPDGPPLDATVVFQPRSLTVRRQTRSTTQAVPRREPVFPPMSLFKGLHENNLSKRAGAVVEYRGGKDLYTQQEVDLSIEGFSYEVDHVCETQVGVHAMQAALRSRATNCMLVWSVKQAFNPESLVNYNVTEKSINASKGQLFKRFLKFHGWDDGYGIAAIALTYKCKRFMTDIVKALQESVPAVEELIRDSKRQDRHITNDFNRVADVVGDYYARMNIDEF